MVDQSTQNAEREQGCEGTDFRTVCHFLQSPAAFDDGTISIKRVETHASYVFLGQSIVYKIKRPVTFPYMDFRALEQRRANCFRELELNRKTAPEIYLDVVAITREKTGDLKINGDGEVIEWAVKMRRFPEEDVFYCLAKSNSLDQRLMADLAEVIAEFHQALPPLKKEHAATELKNIILGLGKSFAAIPSNPLIESAKAFITSSLEDFDNVKAMVTRRANAGMLRRCHGDMHMKNIVLWQGRPTPFDALEFNDDFAEIDVLYDLAFLLMDLIHLKQKEAANTLLNRYVLHAWPLLKSEGLRLLPFFMSLRAGIRALVSLEQDANSPALAQEYFDLAMNLQKQSDPVLIVVGGLSGTGKSTLSKELALRLPGPLGAVWLRSDLERKHLFASSEYSTLEPEFYSEAASAMVYNLLIKKANIILKQGQSVLIDAVFLNRQEQEKVEAAAKKQGTAFKGMLLTAPAEILFGRVDHRRNDASDADRSVVKKQISHLRESRIALRKNWIEIDASGTPDQTLKNTLKVLENENLIIDGKF